MKTNQITQNKELNLSVTDNSQKDNCSSNAPGNNSRQSKSALNKDNSYNQSPECSGGICSTAWKPLRHIA